MCIHNSSARGRLFCIRVLGGEQAVVTLVSVGDVIVVCSQEPLSHQVIYLGGAFVLWVHLKGTVSKALIVRTKKCVRWFLHPFFIMTTLVYCNNAGKASW